MINTLERRSISERYSEAACSTDTSGQRTDADILLAAGYAAAGNERGSLALDLWRMRETRDIRGIGKMTELSANWLIGRPNGRTRLARKMPRIEALDLAGTVLGWWLHSTCQTCQGRGHPMIAKSKRIDSSRECGDCRGTGVQPLDTLVKQDHREKARWLAGEYDAMAGGIFARMAEKLAPKLELP